MTACKLVLLITSFALAGANLSCRKQVPAHASVLPGAKTETHKHADEEKSDLDRPIKELVTLTCEHGKKTYHCDECRYEVGFVRVPGSVIEGGLFKTTHAERQRIAVPIALTGEVSFDERRVGHVSTQVEGIIKRVHVALGDQVKKDQPLVEVESVMVGEGQSAYQEAKAMLDLARRNFERAAALRRENISSEKEFLQAKQELEAAQIRAQGARSKLSRLGTSGAGGRVFLRAPVGGTVLVMHAVSGEVTRSQESLITVGDNTAVWLWADLYERDIAAVKKGQATGKLAATVSVKAYPGEDFPGLVDLVSPAMDETSRTVKLRVAIKNSDGRLLSGMFANVKVFLPGSDESLALPRQAVLDDEGRWFVFVHHQGDDYVRRPVEIGRRWAGWVEIKKGIDPAQTVVADGAFLMKSDVLRSKMGAGCAD
jgi:cobalt-zinc-cadmium efflux system membrane fusion protein